ncbi:hypothetical protein BZA77DRAFT_372483, partial [Pyronema omphalodes]
YVPNPRGRGTVDLVLSSVITLMLCVYTSIHLNIAPDSAKPMLQVPRATVYKFYWVFIALFAPEVVLFSAYHQWKNARALCKALKDLDEEEENLESDGPPQSESLSTTVDDQTDTAPKISVRDLLRPTISASPEAKVWSDITMTSAFFVVMGGFAYRRGKAFQIQDDKLKFPYLMLTPEGFLALAKEKVITPGILDHKSIADRSKADSLAKFMVCIQAFWMVLNVIARKASGLPSTLIELNVVVHVAITVAVYIMWWNKPLAVQNPIVLNPLHSSNDSEVPDISHIGSEEENFKLDKELWNLHAELLLLHPDDTQLKYLDYSNNIAIRRWAFYSSMGNILRQLIHWIPESHDFNDLRVKTVSNAQINSSILEESGLKLEIMVREGPEIDPWLKMKRKTKILPTGILLRPRQLLVWKTVSDRALFASYIFSGAHPISKSKIVLLKQLSLYCDKISDRNSLPIGSKACLYARVNPPNIDLVRDLQRTSLGIFYFFLSAILISITYAGCHFTAWNSHFPTLTERTLWRGSCIVIASTIFVALLLCIFIFLIVGDKFEEESFHKYFSERNIFIAKLLYWVFSFSIVLIMLFLGLLYVAARIFIILEAFMSVRNLPLGAYDTVDWIEYFPHV